MKRSTWIGIGSLAAGLLLFGVIFYGCRQPPQMGADDEVFRAVDALYTAVTAREEKLLAQCEAKLNALKQAGKVPSDAAAYLDDVIATARQGNWQRAAERLYRFMEAQRRDGRR